MKHQPATPLPWAARPVIPSLDLQSENERDTKLYLLMRGNQQVDTESTPEEKAYLRAHFQSHCVLPEFLKKGAKAQDVPYVTTMRNGFYETVQDIASQIITHSQSPEIVGKLATELYEEATRRMGNLAVATIPHRTVTTDSGN